MLPVRSNLVAARRRGVILLVVLVLLTLFAIVGISFVIYADSAAKSAQIAKEAEVATRADVHPEFLASLFLTQLLFDVKDDESGVYSALRGYSLARSMFGFRYDMVKILNTVPQRYAESPMPNTIPYNGIGRPHTGPTSRMSPWEIDDHLLLNYTFFQNNHYEYKTKSGSKTLQVRLLRDPERLNQAALAAFTNQEPPWRQDPNSSLSPPGPFAGGWNAPYTYPDLNNLFLASVRAEDGAVLLPSFHRPYLSQDFPSEYAGFGNLGPTNPNWYFLDDDPDPAKRKPWLKYMTLRPRPVDQLKVQAFLDPQTKELRYKTVETWPPDRPYFPPPEDDGGDVKNLMGSPGLEYFVIDPKDPLMKQLMPKLANNDSIWIDLGAPVMVAPDGRKYKALFAPLIVDLDNRVNLNVHGNMLGQDGNGRRFFAGNQNWGPWSVNLAAVLNWTPDPKNQVPTEWQNIFKGASPPYRAGKYGLGAADLAGTAPFPFSLPGTVPHIYAPVDYNEWNNNATGDATKKVDPLNTFAPDPKWSLNSFPVFQQGYDNAANAELQQHPSLYNLHAPSPGTRRFALSNLEALLRFGDTNSPSLTSELLQLCPQNFIGGGTINNPTDPADPQGFRAAAKRRQLVTLRSYDIDRPGTMPWIWRQDGQTSLRLDTGLGHLAPSGPAIRFPGVIVPPPPQKPNDPKKPNDVDLTQMLNQSTVDTKDGQTKIPTGDFAPGDGRSLAALLGRLDLNRPLPDYPRPNENGLIKGADALAQFNAAQTARQQLAADIYVRLIQATGAYDPFTHNHQLVDRMDNIAKKIALRWLAQLAVNIVDFIDNDDYITPFNWGMIGNKEFRQDPQFGPSEWVFGTELPRLVINEAFVQYRIPTAAGLPYQVKVWVELHNPLPLKDGKPDPSLTEGGAARIYVPNGASSYSPYQLVLCKSYDPKSGRVLDGHLRRPQNVSGDPGRLPVDPLNFDFVHKRQLATSAPAGVYIFPPSPATIPPSGGAADGPSYYLMGPPWTKTDPYPDGIDQIRNKFTQDDGLAYEDDRVGDSTAAPYAPALVLRRLACPHLEPNPPPGGTLDRNKPYNPYVTVDYMDYVCAEHADHPVPNQRIRANNQDIPGNESRRRSDGRSQPYIATNKRPLRDFQPYGAGVTSGVRNTFGSINLPRKYPRPKQTVDLLKVWPASNEAQLTDGPNSRRWLLHLDRPLVSPMELLHVSGFKPHELTQQFARVGNALDRIHFYGHRVPWYDEDFRPNSLGEIVESHRLYRFFELVATRSRASGFEAAKVYNKADIQAGVDVVVTPERIQGGDPYQLPAMSGLTMNDRTDPNRPVRSPHGVPWSIQPGSVLIFEPGTRNQENVVVKTVFNKDPDDPNDSLKPPISFKADFYIKHPKGCEIQITTLGDRIPGKLNLNTIQEPEPFQAACNPGINPYTGTNPNNYEPADIYNPDPASQSVFRQMLISRQTGYQSTNPQPKFSPKDRPFPGMATGFYGKDAFLFEDYGVDSTFFRPFYARLSESSLPLPKRLFTVPVASSGNFNKDAGMHHPYEGQQLFTRTGNTFTSRSNVFAVWVTVGFFEVIQDSVEYTDANGQKQVAPVRPVKLGAELGRAENRHVRHRFFAIVDRSHLTVPSDVCRLRATISAGTQLAEVLPLDPANQPNPFYATINPTPVPTAENPLAPSPKEPPMTWAIQPRDRVVVGYGQPNQETVEVDELFTKDNKYFIQARFTRPHFADERIAVAVIPGNPGPQPRLNVRDPLYQEVVPYLSIIE
jgi:hypothetical protein